MAIFGSFKGGVLCLSGQTDIREEEGKSREQVVVMPTRKRLRRERTHDWQEIQQQTLWPEQEVYERLRPKSRSGNILTHNVNNEAVIYLVVLRENTYPHHFFDERNVDHEGTTNTPSPYRSGSLDRAG